MKLNYSIQPITKKDIQDGDTFVTRTPGAFLSDCIREEMLKLARNLGIDCKMNDIYSHAGKLYWENGKLMIYEAIETGFKPRIFDDHYSFGLNNAILRYEPGYSVDEMKRMKDFRDKLVDENISYQFWNFLQWIAVINFHSKRAFDKNTDKFVYCYEATYKQDHAAIPSVFKDNGEQTSIFKLYENKVRHQVIG